MRSFFRVASRNVFGPEQPVMLHLIEIPPVIEALKGVGWNWNDCAFPLLKNVVAKPISTRDSRRELGFAGRQCPRKAGMERKDLTWN